MTEPLRALSRLQITVAVFASVVLAYMAFDFSFLLSARRVDPEGTYRTRPTEPGVVAAAMNYRMVQINEFKIGVDDKSNIRAGLVREPLNRVLLRTLAIQDEISGRQEHAKRKMELASQVSRRDTITQLWLGEYFRRSGKPEREIAHYHAALQVKPDLRKVLFPKIMSSLQSPEYQKNVGSYLRQDVDWAAPFLITSTLPNVNLVDLDDVLNTVEPFLGLLSKPKFTEAVSNIIFRLEIDGRRAEALSVMRNVWPDFDVNRYSQFGWNASNTDNRLGTLAWKFADDANISPSLTASGALTLWVAPGVAVEGLARDVSVRPGTSYVISHHYDNTGTPAPVGLKWQGFCIAEDKISSVWESAMQMSKRKGVHVFQFVTPANCHLMRIVGSVVGPDSQLPGELNISTPILKEAEV
ncbi:hypothetical protein QUA95_28665 [Microcoleus sp. F10_A2]|jgi:hypothetical protein